MPKQNLLITGASGFLGRHAARFFSQRDYNVYGIGRGALSAGEVDQLGLVDWVETEISSRVLEGLNVPFDGIVHCAGGASVAKSIDDPADDFHNTVSITLEVLEYVRRFSPTTKLIYPSSAAVYGEHDATPIAIDDPRSPASPYGVHKKIVEDLCLSYSRFFEVDVAIIRFFSIYGPGLKKQLIWDACNKLKDGPAKVVFWGSGNETRDWIYITDALELIRLALLAPDCPLILNGGCGTGVTISNTLSTLVDCLGLKHTRVEFNGEGRPGDPCHYEASLKECEQLGWRPDTDLEAGLGAFVSWFEGLPDD